MWIIFDRRAHYGLQHSRDGTAALSDSARDVAQRVLVQAPLGPVVSGFVFDDVTLRPCTLEVDASTFVHDLGS